MGKNHFNSSEAGERIMNGKKGRERVKRKDRDDQRDMDRNANWNNAITKWNMERKREPKILEGSGFGGPWY